MGVVMGVTAVLAGVAAALVGLIVWTALIFQGPAASARAALEERPGRCFLTGLTLAVTLGVTAIALLRSPHGLAKLGGWALALPLFSVLLLGLTGMSQMLGERLRELSPSTTPLGALVRGAVTLELASLMPFLGWFLFAPLVGLTVLGAGFLGSFRTTETRRMEKKALQIEKCKFQIAN